MNPENEIDKTEALEPVETAAANVAEARGGVDGRKRPKWLLPLIAVVCAVVLVVAGVVGWNMYRGAKLAEAKEACATAADGVRSQANEYNALLNGHMGIILLLLSACNREGFWQNHAKTHRGILPAA